MRRPPATGHTLAGRLPPPRNREALLWGETIRSRAGVLPASVDPGRGVDSTPIGRRVARVLAHTQCRVGGQRGTVTSPTCLSFSPGSIRRPSFSDRRVSSPWVVWCWFFSTIPPREIFRNLSLSQCQV